MSFLGPSQETLGIVSSLQAVIGQCPVEEVMVGSHRCYRLPGVHRGRQVEVFVSTRHQLPRSVRFAFSLGGRPITLQLNHRCNTTILAVPEVRTGDPTFDNVFLVNGFPDEVLRELLDEPTRGWLLQRYSEHEPTLETEEGNLRIATAVATHPAFSATHLVRDLPAAEISAWLDWLLAATDRLVSSFDRHCEAIARAQGPAAAQQWAQSFVVRSAARDQRRHGIRIAVFALFVGLPLLVVVLVLGAVVLATMLR